MINLETIRYSLRNLKKQRSRSLLTIFSIFVGITTIFIFVSFGLGLFNYTNDLVEGSSANFLIIQAKGPGLSSGLDTTFRLDDDDLRAVERSSGVLDATGVYFRSVEILSKGERRFTLIGAYDPKEPYVVSNVFDLDLAKGRELTSGDRNKVILGNNYLYDDKIFSRALDINDEIKINGDSLKVVGFFEAVGNPQDDAQIYVSSDYFEDLYPNASYNWIVAEVDRDQIERTTENIEKSLRKERNLEEGKEDFFVQSFQDLVSSYSSVLSIIIGFVLLIAFISIIVSAVNTANTMITSVLERFKEIGILKAIGAKNSEIFGIFLFESSFLGFVAGIVGVGLGYVITSLAGKILLSIGYGFLQPAHPALLFVGLILFAVVTGALSGIFPAINASKTNTVEALRYE